MRLGNSRRFILTILVLLIIPFLGTGCASAPQTGQPGGPAPAIIEIWDSLTGNQATVLQNQVDAINKAHPEVVVKLKYVPEQTFASYSYQAEAGGEGPEIFIARREVIQQLYSQGTLAKTAYTDQASFPAARAIFSFGGSEYALPWLTDVPMFYFRTDGAGVPKTLADLFSAQGGGVSVTAANTAELAAWWNGQGGGLFAAGKPALNAPANLTFLQQLLAWQTGQTLRVDPQALTAFTGGQTPYLIAGASQAVLFNKIPWGCVPLMNLTGGQGAPMLGYTVGIANSAVKTEQLASAIKVVEEALLQPEVEGVLTKAGGVLPANMDYYKLSEASQGVFPEAYTALSKAWALQGDSPEWKLIPVQDKAWSNVLTGGIAPPDALTAAQAEAASVLSK